jgi:hypothetical protein
MGSYMLTILAAEAASLPTRLPRVRCTAQFCPTSPIWHCDLLLAKIRSQ